MDVFDRLREAGIQDVGIISRLPGSNDLELRTDLTLTFDLELVHP